ncbi:Trp repressor protein [Clostridium liquoris]|jgi:TrpR-related protein YerC/YecD|uniref:Trp repressor protein n=1 Tax=Clostridium liquoris TaxID=1289519 RepID=A0A2T0B5B2_9CLOT|nr:YerC/YecD family TrpR-related protein [Clostridium liquoris]PRR79066.1 Trp repressor protein [Clostridium liquoris]
MSDYRSKVQSKEMDFLCEAVLTLETKEECYRFFDDICTINEIQALEQRMKVAKMLNEKRTYQDISSTTGASTATISRVNRCLNYGSDGYNIVLKRLENKIDEQDEENKEL